MNKDTFSIKKKVIIIANYFFLIPFIIILMIIIINNELIDEVVLGKYFWFYFWIGVAALLIPIQYILNRVKITPTKTDGSILLFGITSFICSYIINSEMNTRIVLFILILILYFYFRFVLSMTLYSKNIFIFSLLITGIIEAIWGIRQLYGFSDIYNLFIITGSFFNPGPYAGYLSIIAPIALYYILYDYKIIKQKLKIKDSFYYLRWGFSLFTFIIILSILPSTMSRASWIAFTGGCTFVFIVFLWDNYNLKRHIQKSPKYLKIIILLIMIIGVIGAVRIYHLKKDSADGRLLMWKVSLKIIPNHPFGVGIGNFPGTYADGQAEYFASQERSEQEKFVAGNPEYAFNEYLQICVEMGIIPFLLFTAGIITAIYSGYKNKCYAEVGSLLSLLIFAGMSYPFNILPFLILLALLMAICVTEENKRAINRKKKLFSTMFIFTNLIVLSSIVIICIYNRYPTYEAYKDWKYAKKLSNMGYHSDSKDGYEKLFSLFKDQSFFSF